MSLKTVDEYNDRVRTERLEMQRKLKMTGVACPKCGQEMEWLYGSPYGGPPLQWPIPTTSPAHCRHCNLNINLEK